MRFKRVAEWIFLSFCLLFLVVRLGTQPLGMMLLRQFLSGIGVNHFEAEFAFPGLTELHFRNVQFRYERNGAAFSGTFSEVAISHQLFRTRGLHLDRVRFQNGSLLPEDDAGESSHSSRPENPEPYSLRFLRTIPISELIIEDLSVGGANLFGGKINGTVHFAKDVEANLDVQAGAGAVKGVLSIDPESGAFRLSGLTRIQTKQEFPVQSSGTLNPRNGALTGRITVGVPTKGRSAAGQFHYAAGGGAGDLELKLRAAELESLPELLADYLPLTLQLPAFGGKSGAANLSLSWSNDRPPGLGISLSARELSVAGVSFSDFTAAVEAHGGEPRELNLQAAAKAFDGDLQLSPATIRVNQPEWKFAISGKGISVDSLLAKYPVQGLSADGKLSASLILEHSPAGFEIKDGVIEAEPPGGTIRYSSGPDGENGALSVAVQALADFHYQTLHAPVTLAPDGTLIISLFLRGANPGWQNGRTVEFTIKIDQNVYDLLRSIRLSQGDLGALGDGPGEPIDGSEVR